MIMGTMKIPRPLIPDTTEDVIGVVERIVEHHNFYYKSVNFGEPIIKEMVMSSAFGIPLSPTV